jgi:hypothetical protein
MHLDDLVPRLYRAAQTAPDAAWRALLKDAALSLSACTEGNARPVMLITDTVLSLAAAQGQLEKPLVASLRAAMFKAGKPTVQPVEQGAAL